MIDWVDRLLQADVQQFLAEHKDDNLAKLALSLKTPEGFPTQEALLQIELRRKAALKLPEWYAHTSIVYPSKLCLEQCSSIHTAQYKQHIISGSHLIDLTGGLGVDTYYLSEKFDSTDYVEQDPRLVEAARHNFSQLGSSEINCHHTTAEEFLNTISGKVDYFYIDPARRAGGRKTYFLEDTFPNITALHPILLGMAKGYLLKASPMLDIKQGLKRLSHVKEVHVLSVDNECKEVLFHITSTAKDSPKIIAANCDKGNWEQFEFTYEIEAALDVTITEPLQYIYEPNSAIIKAGAFKSIPQKYELSKLHSNTHLYTSNERLPSFPGRVFLLNKVVKADKKSIGRAINNSQANLASRNFPVSVAELKKKWSIRDGGDQYLFATTLVDNRKAVLVCEKLSQE
ncbi:MAG: SAM-dependent methyltransferase [Cyclobacteriaceae bacterium]